VAPPKQARQPVAIANLLTHVLRVHHQDVDHGVWRRIARLCLRLNQFRGRKIIIASILITMILPFEVYFIPLYQMVASFRLGSTHLALILEF
jgi:hypothetical protein